MYEILFGIAVLYGVGVTFLLMRCLMLRLRPEVLVEREMRLRPEVLVEREMRLRPEVLVEREMRLRPEVLVEREIAIYEMPVNSIGWTVPWAFYCIGNNTYVNGKYTTHRQPGGTVTVRFIRTLTGVEIDQWPCYEIIKDMDSHWGFPLRAKNAKVHPEASVCKEFQ